MAQKIILFLSDLKDGATGKDYHHQNDKDKRNPIPGVQTNDAPVRYLLRSNGAVEEVICVVTEKARSALAHFEQVVHEEAPGAKVVEIPYEEKQSFSDVAIPAILAEAERGDEIYLDVTGGFRNANMHLLLLSRVLSYKGIRTAGAVYSNLWTSTVEDVSHLFRLFDLVDGMQELTSLGNAQTLRRYYEAEPGTQDPDVKDVIDCMARLTEDITLCHTAQIKQRMDEFNHAMEKARECSDPLMRVLLDVFRATFGEEMTTPGLVRWCVNNDMIQQALTVYTEHIPDVIMGGEILRRGSSVKNVSKKEYENQAAVQFLRDFLTLSDRPSPKEARAANLRNQLHEYVVYRKEEILQWIWNQTNQTTLAPPAEIAAGVENLVLVARLAYPNGHFNASWADGLPPEKARLRELEERFERNAPGRVRGFINHVRTFSRNELDCLLEEDIPAGSTGSGSHIQSYIRTLRDLPELLPGSGYEAACSFEQLAQISRDYLYIKALRNMANHANDKPTDDQDELMSYLMEYGYTHPAGASLSDIKDAILAALDNLHEAEEGKKEA